MFLFNCFRWVNNGNTLIVVNNIDHWADHLAKKEVIDYRGAIFISIMPVPPQGRAFLLLA